MEGQGATGPAAQGAEPPRPSAAGLVSRLAAATGLGGPLGPSDLALFAEHLAGLVRAKLPLPKALRMLGRDAESQRLRSALAEIEKEVAAGASFTDALRKRSRDFPPLFTWMVAQGVGANDLHAALVELVSEYRAQARFREALYAQLLSPFVTVLFLGFFFIWLLLWNVPGQFRDVYQNMRVTLPLPTRLVFSLSDWVCQPLGLLLLFLLLAAALWSLWWGRFGRGRGLLRHLALRSRILGPYLRAVLLARFCRSLHLLLRRKLPLPAALEFMERSAEFGPLAGALGAARAAVAGGAPLSQALADAALFPAAFRQFLAGAEAHGELVETLARLGEHYEERAEHQGTQVRVTIYVASILLLAVVVGAVVLSIFLPILKIQEALRQKKH